MAFPCSNYEDFTSGQCTWQLIKQSYYRSCIDPQPAIVTITTNMTACPIRLGLESELDYRKQQLARLTPSSEDHRQASSGLVYFMQTADRMPFCHYHYDLTLVLRTNLYHYKRNYRTRKFSENNSVLLNGRLEISLIGMRSRTSLEVVFKHGEVSEGRIGGGSKDSNIGEKVSFKEYHLMVSYADLGSIHRIELEWRPSSLIQPILPLISKQPRSLRRWLPQLSNLENSLPNVLSELQRTLSVNASHLHAQTSLLLNWPNPLNDFIHSKNGHGEYRSGTESNLNPTIKESTAGSAVTVPVASTTATLPLLEAVIITKLETGERQLFCANEPALRTIFQNKPISRTGVLITSTVIVNSPEVMNVGRKDDELQHLMNTESLIQQYCIRDIL